MAVLSNSRHEAFAQARFSGMGVMEAYRAAGYAGQCPKVASSVSQHPEVKARIIELHNAAGTAVAYKRLDAINDLLAIIHGRPCDASAENPLCEPRSSRHGPYHRFPSKLRALARLVKIMGWDEPPKEADEDEDVPDRLTQVLMYVRTNGRRENAEGADSADEWDGVGEAEMDELQNTNHKMMGGGPVPLTPRQEAFAQARFQGMKVTEAYEAAGYTGDASERAWKVNQHPAVKARIAELRKAAEDAVPYKKHEAINDLVAMIHASPAEAGPDQPLCETRMGHEGLYYRFPCKLAAMMQLVRLMRWHEPEKVDAGVSAPKKDSLDEVLDWVRGRK